MERARQRIEKGILVENLDLMPGYRAERNGTGISLVDPEGRRVARLLGSAASGQEWQDLCESLVMLAYSHAVECEVLRERVEKLEKRLREVEKERDTSDRLAEGLYKFFSHTARSVAQRKRYPAGESGQGLT